MVGTPLLPLISACGLTDENWQPLSHYHLSRTLKSIFKVRFPLGHIALSNHVLTIGFLHFDANSSFLMCMSHKSKNHRWIFSEFKSSSSSCTWSFFSSIPWNIQASFAFGSYLVHVFVHFVWRLLWLHQALFKLFWAHISLGAYIVDFGEYFSIIGCDCKSCND